MALRLLSHSLEVYSGHFIAIVDGEIVAVGASAEAARARARASYPQRLPTILRIADERTASIPAFLARPALARVHRHVLQLAPTAALVGGAVRDLLLDLPSHDLDYVVEGDALSVARRLADRLQAAYYPLDPDRGIGRVVWRPRDDEPLVIDLAPPTGSDLETDLRRRDFTVNAIALLPDGRLLDPLGGRDDLERRQLRPCADDSLTADPVRVLRAVRFALTFGLQPTPALEAQVPAAVRSLDGVSVERLRDEMLRLLALPQPQLALRHLQTWAALDAVLPELTALLNLAQPRPHVDDAYEHSLAALAWAARLDRLLRGEDDPADALEVTVLAALLPWQTAWVSYLQEEPTVGHPRWLWLRLAALAHDWGKPATRSVDAQGRIHFYHHEEVSAERVTARLQSWRCSTAATTFVRKLCREHMRPLYLARSGNAPSRRSLYRLYRDLGELVPALALLHLADHLATYGPELDPMALRRYLPFVKALIEPAFDADGTPIVPKPLLNGQEIMALTGLESGPPIGQLLEKLREAQALGNVTTRDQAVAFVKRLAGR
ncbi:MAG: HD domain-containing protein [Caldilineales bacterium]|nr:HD domain-containing protein [Caldilineales bacterium]